MPDLKGYRWAFAPPGDRSFAMPTGAQPGDLLVLLAADGRTADTVAARPSQVTAGAKPFTLLGGTSTPGAGFLAYKVLDGQDFLWTGDAYPVTWTGKGGPGKDILLLFTAGTFDPSNPIGWWSGGHNFEPAPINAAPGAAATLQQQTVWHFGATFVEHQNDDPLGTYGGQGVVADIVANRGTLVTSRKSPRDTPWLECLQVDPQTGLAADPTQHLIARLYREELAAAGTPSATWTLQLTDPFDPNNWQDLSAANQNNHPGYLNNRRYSDYKQYGLSAVDDHKYTDAWFVSLVINDPTYVSTILPMESTATVLTSPYAAVLRDPANGVAVRSLTPTLLAYVDGSTSPMQVQFQVASDTAFGSVVFDQTLTGQVTGPVSATVSPALTDGQFYRWRARAGSADGSTWGPWSSVWVLRPSVQAGRAVHYSYENLSPQAVLYQGDAEYSYENTGAQAVLVPHVREYVTENVGFEITVKPDAVDYVYEGDVSTNAPTPHLWFAWRPFGFASDVVFLYGMGLGASAAERNGHLFIDPGPDYSTPDVSPAVADWYEVPAGDHAYDDQRTIYPGTDAVPPNVTTQVQVVKWVAPTSIVPSEAAATMLLYISTSVAVSNKVGWLMYPTLPTAVGNVARPMSSHTVMRLSAPLELAEGIEQLWAHQDAPTYLVALGRPVRMPAFSAGATSRAELGSWSTQSALAAALDVDLGATYRWLPDDTTVVAAPTLGTGVSTWVPKVGANAVRWRFDADSAPYIDPTYEIVTRLGAQTVPAMVFPGDAWAKMLTDANLGPYWTIAMVAVLHPGPDGTGTLLGTYQDTPTVGAEQLKLQLNGDRLSLLNGGRLNTQLLQNVSQRPVIIALSKDGDSHSTNLVLVDKSPSSKVTRYAGYPADAKLWLGRTSELGALMYPAAMEVLDLVWWDHTLSAAEVWAAINKLDGIYGVTG